MAFATTTLALLGAGAIAGGALAKKKLTAPKPKPEVAAPIVSTDPRRPPISTIPAPPSAAQAGSAAAGIAQNAAIKQRRRAAAGSVASKAMPTGSVLAGRFEPRTLVGY